MSDSSDSEFDDLAAAIKSFDSEKDEESSENEVVKSESESEDEKPEKKPKRRKIVDPEQQKELDKFLFGDKKGLLKNLEGNKFFFTDTTGDAEDGSSLKSNACVWHDSDDEDFKKTTENGEIRNKRKFDRITGVPKWARIDKGEKAGDDSSDDDEISKTVGHLAKKVASKDLDKSELAFKRLAHINKTTLKEGRTSAIVFHPNSTVGIVAGLKGMVSMFAIDGRENKKIHNVRYEKFPIYSCMLNNDGDELIIGGLDTFFHTYNLLSGYKQRTRLPQGVNNLKSFSLSPCGKYMAVIGEFGEIHLLHALTKELLNTMKQEHQSTSISFSMDSKKLFSHSDDNEVTIFDLRAQRAEHRFVDDGCVNGTSLAISENGKLIATGSRQGFVNIYNYDDVLAQKLPQPAKIISNLTTEVTDLKFNPTSEMLAMCSSDENNAMKIVHFPSATVFNNFPSRYDKIGKATVLAFSPASGYMGVGTIGGIAPLYRLRHYSNY